MQRSRFCVGGVAVEVRSENGSAFSLSSALLPFQVDECSPDIDLRLQFVENLASPSARAVFDSGAVWRLYELENGFQFDFTSTVFGNEPYKRLLVGGRFDRATLQLNQACFAERGCSATPLDYPLDELLITHRLTQERAIELHGVGIVGPDGANHLFVGHSGAGKSTTARLWHELYGAAILSDDRIIVRDAPGCHGEDAGQIFMYGTPWHGDAAFALPEWALLQRIIVLEHGRGNVLTRLSASQTVAELFARSFVPFHRHEYIDSALSFLQHVAASVPCYRYSFEPDARAVERIINFRD